MHRDPEVVVLAVSANLPERVGKVFLPGEGADRMGSKWDKVGRYPEKQEAMLGVVSEDLLKTGQV
jgi:hypothetical protein